MKSLPVRSLRGPYRILVGENLLRNIGGFFKPPGFSGKVMVVTQEKVARHFLKPVAQSLRKRGIPAVIHYLADGEEAKTQRELFRLLHALVDADFERRDMILALGGGTVGDAAGFAAAAYLRGIGYVNAGTTLLAQVDSSIGGKTGINLAQGKNLVGAFYPPRLVISDVRVLETLPEREFRASFGEVVKYGMIRDAKLFALLEESAGKILQKNSALLQKIVLASARIKAEVVSRDEFETSGERMILNFGHTFAHAFEQALGYRKLLHGEAVAAGMVCAARLAGTLKIFSREGEARLSRLLESFHLPVSLAGLDLDASDVLAAMDRDKKKRAGALRFVLPVRIGKVIIRNDISLPLVEKVLKESGAR